MLCFLSLTLYFFQKVFQYLVQLPSYRYVLRECGTFATFAYDLSDLDCYYYESKRAVTRRDAEHGQLDSRSCPSQSVSASKRVSEYPPARSAVTNDYPDASHRLEAASSSVLQPIAFPSTVLEEIVSSKHSRVSLYMRMPYCWMSNCLLPFWSSDTHAFLLFIRWPDHWCLSTCCTVAFFFQILRFVKERAGIKTAALTLGMYCRRVASPFLLGVRL